MSPSSQRGQTRKRIPPPPVALASRFVWSEKKGRYLPAPPTEKAKA